MYRGRAKEQVGWFRDLRSPFENSKNTLKSLMQEDANRVAHGQDQIHMTRIADLTSYLANKQGKTFQEVQNEIKTELGLSIGNPYVINLGV